MNKSTAYALSFSVTVFMLAMANMILIAPDLSMNVLPELQSWQRIFLGGVVYFLGFLSLAVMIFDYPAWLRRSAEISLAILLTVFLARHWMNGLLGEFLWLIAAAVALVVHPWIKIKVFDWLQLATLVANTLIGVNLLAYPQLAGLNMPTLAYEPMRISMAIGFLSSALIAIFAGLHQLRSSNKDQWHLLGIPWLLWALLAGLNNDILQVVLALSVSIGLLSSEIVPWEKVILREGKQIGRRFFQILVGGQVISLFIIITFLVSVERLNLESDAVSRLLSQVGLVSAMLVTLLGLTLIILSNLSINGIFSGLNSKEISPPSPIAKPRSIISLLRWLFAEPFRRTQQLSRQSSREQKEYERLLEQTILSQKRRMAQLNLLQQLNLQLETVLDPPVSAQLTANATYGTLGGVLCAIFEYDAEKKEMAVLAASGTSAHSIQPGYRQSIHAGLIGRAARLRRSQLVSDTRLDPDFVTVGNENFKSELVVPILHFNQLKGCIVIDHNETQAFDDSDISTLETIALRLVSSWQRSEQDQRLTRLIQVGVSLSKTLEVEAVINQVTEIAQTTIDARFVFVALVDKGGGFTRVGQAGYAPTLSSMLNSDPAGNTLIQAVLNQVGPIRIRDVRKRFNSIATGSSDLRNMLGVPIRLRQSNIGVVLAFGKINANTFDENDEGLINLLASQAAAAVETTWLYQELRTMLNTATQLYKLSSRVIQAEKLTDAAAAIAETIYQLSQAKAAGITLLNTEKQIEAQVQIDNHGMHPGTNHPIDLIKQTLQSGQSIMLSGENEIALVCIPLQTPRNQYGALWLEVPERVWTAARFSENLHTLANQAAIALERSILLTESIQQAEQIEAAYHKLETTYDQTLAALSSALDARDRETEGHSIRVARLTCMLGQQLGFDETQLKILERGAILHDIGKIGISDTILLKPGKLTEEEWEVMRQHPDIGARIIEGIPFLEDTLPIIRYHQERWDGSGYPLGLKGKGIPLAARIFAVVDAYDALTSDRPYRKKTTSKEALDYLHEKSGELFDPEIVDALEELLQSRGEKGP